MHYEEQSEAIESIIGNLLNALSEYCDAVQVHASFICEDGETSCLHKGEGNWFARRGMAKEFIERDEARSFMEIKTKEYEDDTI